MNNLYKKLNNESDHIRLTAEEKRAIRMRVFGVPSAVVVTRSSYVFLSQRWMVALASLLLVVFAGGSTAFAAEGALPGEPLYGLKTGVLEPVQLALASTPAAKAAVHVALAERRVEEAEALAGQGTLSATTSAELAANFETHAQSADALADEVATSDPAASVQIRTQLNASSAAGGAVLAALGRNGKHSGDQEHADAVAARVLARAGATANGTASAQTQPKAAVVRTFAVTTALAPATGSGSSDSVTETAADTGARESTAAQLEQKAQAALEAARAQYALASSTLDAGTTVAVNSSIAGVETLISGGSAAMGSSQYDTAVKDFTEALARAVKLGALLKAQHKFDNHIIIPLLKLNSEEDSNSSHGDGGN